MELDGNSRNRASAAWGTFGRMLAYKCERESTHFAAVEPANTTNECAECGVKTDKPLWVREHSCPACGFECDRDANAAANILSRGLNQVGVVHSESTPSETATAVGPLFQPFLHVASWNREAPPSTSAQARVGRGSSQSPFLHYGSDEIVFRYRLPNRYTRERPWRTRGRIDGLPRQARALHRPVRRLQPFPDSR